MKDSFLNRKFKYENWNVCLYIIAINLLVYLLCFRVNIYIKGVPLLYYLAMSPFCVRYGWVWQIFSYMFVHGTLSHLLLNMFPLYIFGRVLEREIGSREFLLYYFLCGVLGGVINFLYYYFTGNYGIMILGSSGCVYALLFLTAVFFPNARLLFFFFIPVRMPVAVLFYIVIELMYQITGMGAGVAHLIHLSCIAIGWVYCLVRFKMNPLDMWRRNL